MEQVEAREQGMTTLTQLKKRQPGSGEKEEVEPSSNVEAQKTEVSGGGRPCHPTPWYRKMLAYYAGIICQHLRKDVSIL